MEKPVLDPTMEPFEGYMVFHQVDQDVSPIIVVAGSLAIQADCLLKNLDDQPLKKSEGTRADEGALQA